MRKAQCVLTCYNDGDIEFREIEEDFVSAPRPLYQKTIDQIFANFRGDQKLKKFSNPIIPKHILYANNVDDLVIWYRNPSRRRLMFSEKQHTGTYALPGLLFILKKENLIVKCIKRYTSKAKIYHSIFPNTTGNGMCMGTAQINSKNLKYFEEAVEEAEHKFFNSYFTHKITDALLKSRDKKTFDNSLLSESEYNLKDYLYEYI